MRGRIQLARCRADSKIGPVCAPRAGKFPVPDFRRRVGVVANSSENLEKMPVALEFVIVVARGRIEQIKRFQVMRLGLHLCGQRLIHVKAVAFVKARGSRNRRA